MSLPAWIQPPTRRLGVQLAAFGAVYALSHVAAYTWRPPTGSISAFWPASGIIFAALVLSPRARWPWLLAVGFSVNVGYNLVIGRLLSPTLLLATMNHLDALTGAWLLLRIRPAGITFHRIGDVIALPFVSLLTSTAVGFVATSLIAPVLGLEPGFFLQTWLTAHVISVLILVPLIVTWSTLKPADLAVRWPRWVEAALPPAIAAVLTWLSFGPGATQLQLFPSPYMGMIPLSWAALRFGPRGTTGVALVMTAVLVTTAHMPNALLSVIDPVQRVAMIHLHVGTLATVALILAAGMAELQRAVQTSRESEHRFRALFESSPQAVGVFHEDRLVLHNPAFLAVFGRTTAGDVEQRSIASFYPRDDLQKILSAPAAVSHDLLISGLRPDGSVVPLAIRPGRFDLGATSALLINHRDLTDEIRSAGELRRLNRVLRAITACNQALLHATSEESLLKEICAVIAASEGFRVAWVGTRQHDAACTVRPVAYAGLEEGYLESVKITWADVPYGRGPCGRAIREGRPVACRNVATDPDFAPWREDTLRRGLRSVIALPLITDGKVYAAINFYSAEVDAFDEKEVALLEEMAASLVYGIKALRARELHRQSEEEVHRLLAAAEQGRRVLLSLLEDQRRTEEAKQHSERLYREAMHNSAIGMALVAIDGRWLEVNPALCRIVGYTREELLAATYKAITVADDLAVSLRNTEDLLSGRTDRFELEKRYRHKSGRVVWVHLSVSLVRDAAGKPLHFVSQTQDITGRRLAEESLSAMAERLALALRASKFGVWRYHLQTHETDWDARMFEIFGLPASSDSPTLEAILACVAEDDRETVRNSWHALPSCSRAYRLRIRVAHPNLPERHVELHGMVHDDALGRPAWVIGVAGDITDIVKATSESERLRSQLMQAQKMETLGRLAAGVAHDFNNLLTGINGFVELASSSLPPGHEAYELLGQARRGAMSARDLVRRILNFSRTNQDVARQILNVSDLVRETAPLIAASLPPNISLVLSAESPFAPVEADASQLQQVLLNLCTNGAHAIGARSGEIRLAVRLCTLGTPPDIAPPPGCAAGLFTELSVIDTGSGMDAATLARIWEPFFTTKQSDEGTGLGLPIVHDIVAGHGGGLAVESSPGVGTTFRVYLPMVQRNLSQPKGAVASATPRGQGQRILVVDDEPTVAKVARVSLEKSGYLAEMFTSPEEALARFNAASSSFDLLLVDHNMPGLSGPDLIARVRARAPDLPVILMSGRLAASGTSIDLEGQRVVTLTKPFEIVDLVANVKRALAARGSE